MRLLMVLPLRLTNEIDVTLTERIMLTQQSCLVVPFKKSFNVIQMTNIIQDSSPTKKYPCVSFAFIY